jgi:hypothetical protein
MLQVWCPRCAVPVPNTRCQTVPRRFRHASGAEFSGTETHAACDTPVCLAPDPLPAATPELNVAMPRVAYVAPVVPASGPAVKVYAANVPGTLYANGHLRNCVPLESEDVYLERTGRVLRPGHAARVPSNRCTSGVLVVSACSACADATLRIRYDLDARTLQVPEREFCRHMHAHSSDTHGMAVAMCVAWDQGSNARFLWHVWTDDNDHIVHVLAFETATAARIPSDPAITCTVSVDCTGIAATHPALMHPTWREHVAQRALTRELRHALTPPVLDGAAAPPPPLRDPDDALQPAAEPPASTAQAAAGSIETSELPEGNLEKPKKKKEKSKKPRFRIVLNADQTEPAAKKPRTK